MTPIRFLLLSVLSAFLACMAYDLWAFLSSEPTISQALYEESLGRPWVLLTAGLLTGMLLGHFFL